MTILGISAYYHDAAACVIRDGIVVAAAQEERFTRIKHDPSFPSNAVEYCLAQGKINISSLDAIVFYDKPLLKFERLLETYYAFAPKGIWSFLSSMPVWIKEKIFLKMIIRKELKKLGKVDFQKTRLLFSEHHLSHAASAFYPSPFHESAILTIDGVGEWTTTSIGQGHKHNIKIIKEIRFPHSLGLLYSSFTYYLGFRVNSGEYKVMGLAPYGDPESFQTKEFVKLIKQHIIDIKPDGSFHLNQKYFRYATGLRMTEDKQWEKLLGIPRREPETELKQEHCNLAYAIQLISEEIIIKLAREAKKITNSENLCLAGGVALNCVANGKLLRSGLFKKIYIQPASSDAGGALGAALAVHYIYYKNKRETGGKGDSMQAALLGPSYQDFSLSKLMENGECTYRSCEEQSVLLEEVTDLLAEGKVIGWFQGRMEFGPRALGSRSILADPRNEHMQALINQKIKHREFFRPFAPAVLEEDAPEYFEIDVPSPYMLYTVDLKPGYVQDLPENFDQLPVEEKVKYKKSAFPAITHVNLSSRVQTVSRSDNPLFYDLLRTFKKKTGTGMLLNTSFNVRGEPIVCTPSDAYNCFINTGMDYLVMGNLIFEKIRQHSVKKKEQFEMINT